MEWWNDPRNPEFEGDKVGRPADEEPNQVGKEWQEMQTRLIKRLEKSEEERRKRETQPPTEATHVMSPKTIFWFSQQRPDYDEPGWRVVKSQKIYLQIIEQTYQKGQSRAFKVISPDRTPIIQLGTEKQKLLRKGDIIYTSRVKKIKTRIKK